MSTQQYEIPPHVRQGIADSLERGKRDAIGEPSFLKLWFWSELAWIWARKLDRANERQAWAQQQYQRYMRLVTVGLENRIAARRG